MGYNNTTKGILILLGISLTAAFTVNYFSPVGIALVGQWDETQGVVTAKTKNDVVVNDLEIGDVKIGKQIYDSGAAVFVDARSPEDYAYGHIKGAVSLPIHEFDAYAEAFLEQYPPERVIVTYCSGRTCEDSHRLAQLLIEFGYTNVSVLIDGYPSWEGKGYPIE
jgi:rhodanese-related sulfurtransferase